MKTHSLFLVAFIILRVGSVEASPQYLDAIKGIVCSVPDVTPAMNERFLNLHKAASLKLANQKCALVYKDEKQNCINENVIGVYFEALDELRPQFSSLFNGRSYLPPIVELSFKKLIPSSDYPDTFGTIEAHYGLGTILGNSITGPKTLSWTENGKNVTFITDGATNQFQIDQTQLKVTLNSSEDFVGDYTSVFIKRPMGKNTPVLIEEKMVCHPTKY